MKKRGNRKKVAEINGDNLLKVTDKSNSFLFKMTLITVFGTFIVAIINIFVSPSKSVAANRRCGVKSRATQRSCLTI